MPPPPEEKTGDDADAAGDDTRGADIGPKAPLLASAAAVAGVVGIDDIGIGLGVGSCIGAFGIPSILGSCIGAFGIAASLACRAAASARIPVSFI